MGGQIKPSIELKQQQIRAGLGGAMATVWGSAFRRLFELVHLWLLSSVCFRSSRLYRLCLHTRSDDDDGLVKHTGHVRNAALWCGLVPETRAGAMAVCSQGSVCADVLCDALRRCKKATSGFCVFFFLKVATKIRPSWREFVNGMFLRAQLPCMKEAVFPASAVWIWCKLN